MDNKFLLIGGATLLYFYLASKKDTTQQDTGIGSGLLTGSDLLSFPLASSGGGGGGLASGNGVATGGGSNDPSSVVAGSDNPAITYNIIPPTFADPNQLSSQAQTSPLASDSKKELTVAEAQEVFNQYNVNASDTRLLGVENKGNFLGAGDTIGGVAIEKILPSQPKESYNLVAGTYVDSSGGGYSVAPSLAGEFASKKEAAIASPPVVPKVSGVVAQAAAQTPILNNVFAGIFGKTGLQGDYNTQTGMFTYKAGSNTYTSKIPASMISPVSSAGAGSIMNAPIVNLGLTNVNIGTASGATGGGVSVSQPSSASKTAAPVADSKKSSNATPATSSNGVSQLINMMTYNPFSAYSGIGGNAGGSSSGGGGAR